MIIHKNMPLLYIYDVKDDDLNDKSFKKERGLVGCDNRKEDI
jgi:hypothetical protein